MDMRGACTAGLLRFTQGGFAAAAGHNGAGKTTAISVLTGMLAPSAGDARIGGASILTSMRAIRANLGVCPQFDILWPEITVEEHLRLYAAIKGYGRADACGIAEAAACEVGARCCVILFLSQASPSMRPVLELLAAGVGCMLHEDPALQPPHHLLHCSMRVAVGCWRCPQSEKLCPAG